MTTQVRQVSDGVINDWDVDNLGVNGGNNDAGGPYDYTHRPLHYLERSMIGAGESAGMYDLNGVKRTVPNVGVRWVIALMQRVGLTTTVLALPLSDELDPAVLKFYQRSWTNFNNTHFPDTVILVQSGEELTPAEVNELLEIEEEEES